MKFQYRAVNVYLKLSEQTAEGKLDLTSLGGVVTHIAAVVQGNTPGDIINLEILEGGSRLLEPADVRFSAKTSSGNFVDGMRPVSGIDAGRILTVKLAALTPTRAADITVQLLVLVQPFERH